MKSPNNTLASLGLAATLLFSFACSADEAPSDPSSKLSLLSNGPDLPEECTPCWDAFQECFAQGSDLEVCADQIVECTNACQAPPPPDECLHCAAGFEACALAAADNGATGEDCAAGFEGCLLACESTCNDPNDGCDPWEPQDPQDPQDPNEPHPEPSPEECEQAYNQCFDDLWDQNTDPGQETPQVCDELLQECYAECPEEPQDPTDPQDPQDPQDPNDPQDPGLTCEQAVDICLDGNIDGSDSPFGDNITCDEVLQYCDEAGNGQPDPGEEQPGW